MRRWRAWQQESIARRIFGVTVTVGALTATVRLIAFAKEAIVALRFGTGDPLETFLMALVLPQFAINLVGGSLNAALIPTYIHVRDHSGSGAAHRLLASVTAASLTILVLLSIAVGIAAPGIVPLMAAGFPEAKREMTVTALRWLLPTIVLSGLTTTWGAVLNAGNRFALTSAAPAATSLLTLAFVGVKGVEWGAGALVVGALGGAAVEAALLGWGLAHRGVPLIPRWHGASREVLEVMGQYGPMLTGAFLMGGTSVVSQSMAATLDPGSVSALAYGSRLTSLLLSIGAVAISTAVLPPFSERAAAGDWAALRHALRRSSQWLLAVVVPGTVLLIAFSKPLIALLFERGAFTAADTRVVAVTQAMFLLQVPFFVVSMLLVRLISALRANRILMWGAALNLLVNIVLTYVLMRQLGVAGIALATSLMYALSLAYLWSAADRLLRARERQGREIRR
jgi:putative peptidoglycan lipid II flippase